MLILLAALISACMPTTARSIADLRWEKADPVGVVKTAPLLGCSRVNSCHDSGLYPDKYSVNDGRDELYVWAHRYWDLSGETTVLYVVLNRPDGTWDMLGFQFLEGEWKTGVYGGQGIMLVAKVSIPYDIWYKTPGGSDFPVAIGMTGEPWAVVVTPIGIDAFEYAVVPRYWDR